MHIKVQSIDDLVQSAKGLWTKRLRQLFTVDGQVSFDREMAQLMNYYNIGDYEGFLAVAFRNREGFLEFIKVAELNQVGEYSFVMRELFDQLFLLGARELLQKKLSGIVVPFVDYSNIKDLDSLLLINSASGRFERVDGTSEKIGVGYTYEQSVQIDVKRYRTANDAYVLHIDNNGMMTPGERIEKREIYPVDVKEGRVYKILQPS